MAIHFIVAREFGLIELDTERVGAVSWHLPIATIVIEPGVPQEMLLPRAEFLAILIDQRGQDLEE
jgi:hypothetical protein